MTRQNVVPQDSVINRPEKTSPSSQSRITAAGVHVGSIFFPFVAPAIGWVAFRNDPFVHAHARAALFEALYWKLGLVIAGTISLIHSAVNLWNAYQANWEGFSIWPILGKMLLVYLAFLLLQALNTVLGARQAWRAYQGFWPGRQSRTTA